MDNQHIPQLGAQLKKLRQRLKQTQEQMATSLEKLLKPYQEKGFSLSQSDISRLENEKFSIDVPMLLAYGHLGNLYSGELLKPHYREWLSSQVTMRHFGSDEQADAYLCKLEEKGRLLAFSQFPSSFFQSSEDNSSERSRQIGARGYEEMQFYTIDSLMNFLFSPSSRYTLPERKTILQRYIKVFHRNRFKQLYFFSRHAFPIMSRFPNLELLYEKKTLIMLAPIMTKHDGDVFLEIRDEQLCETVYDFYMHEVEPIEDSLDLLRCAIEAVDDMLNHHSIEHALEIFSALVKQRIFEHDAILENFSVNIREQLAA